MNHYILDPEVSGGLGPHTKMDTSVHPPVVTELHYEVDAWLGDDLIQSFPCYLVSDRLASRLEEIRATGVKFAPAEVTTSDSFGKPDDRDLPTFKWMKVVGKPGADDLGLTPDARLVVSEAILGEMKKFRLNHCIVEEFPHQP